MRAIGGFFELEKDLSGTEGCHPHALALSSGRAAFRAVLEAIRPRHIWIPCYVCDSLLEPLQRLQIPFSFFGVDSSLNPPGQMVLGEGEYLVVVNYFGLNSEKVASLARRWPGQVIIDNTQAFFEGPVEGCFSFNSARKFFGVPDGSFLYSPQALPLKLPENTDITLDHLTRRAAGDLANAYQAFQKAEASVTSELKGISRYTTETLKRVPHSKVCEQRRRNFLQYERAFADLNTFNAVMAAQATPFCYPFLPGQKINRQRLHQRGIFFPTFWPEVIERDGPGFATARMLAQDLLPLPVDHRYGPEEIDFVIESFKEVLNTQTLSVN